MKKMQRLLLLPLLMLIVGSVFRPQVSYAALSAEDHVNLTASLQTLALYWDDAQVVRANDILTNPAYSTEDWQAFFNGYFMSQPLTDRLYEYLGYPVMWWFDDAIHLKLQTGLLPGLQAAIERLVSEHRSELGQTLAANADVNQTLFNAHRVINGILQKNMLDAAAREQVYTFYTQHINAAPELWKSSIVLDNGLQPFVAALRGQIYMNLGDALPQTPARKSEIAHTLQLTGQYASIWEAYTVLVIDNQGLDQRQLEVISNYLGELPVAIHNLRYISVNDFLGNSGDDSKGFANNTNGVNIFSTRVGTWPENGFPEDVTPLYADIFSMALAHMTNYIVDATFQRVRPELALRRQALINEAGIPHMNYLRSTLEDGFFVNSPQIFFASIANEWFASTEHTLELAIVRWANGYVHPINQFLFFAEVYSQGGATVPFYTTDEQGQMTRQDRVVKRDAMGRIIELMIGQTAYQFTLADNGDVNGVSQQAVVPANSGGKAQCQPQKPEHDSPHHKEHGHKHADKPPSKKHAKH